MQLRVPINLVEILAGLKEIVGGLTTLRRYSLYRLNLLVS